MARGIRHLAPVFGSIKTYGNARLEHLSTLIAVTSAKDLDPAMQLTYLRLITSILFLQPSSKLMTNELQDEEWSRFLRHENPSGKIITGLHFSELIDSFAQLGGVQAVLNCLRCNSEPQNILEALRLGVLMLSDGRPSVQDVFQRILSSPTSYSIFEKLQGIMRKALSILRESESSHADNLPKVEVRQVLYVFRMMKGLFMGRQRALQDLFRMQRLNKVSVNLIIEAIAPLGELINDLKGSLDQGNFHIAHGVSEAFEMFYEAMSGPNFHNQVELAGSEAPSLFDLADRVFQKMVLVDSLKKFGRISIRQVAPLEMDTSKLRRRNVVSSKLKQSVTRCLLTFLEGATQNSQQVIQPLLATLQWTSIMSQLDMCYKSLNKVDLIPNVEVMNEGLAYYKLLLSAEALDQARSQIGPLLSRPMSEAAVRFFSQHLGCVEVQQNDRIDRVMFALPTSCMPGGYMNDASHLFEIINTEWSNRDAKNFEFVQILLKLVEKEQHMESLRQSMFGFTIRYGRYTQVLSFFLAVILHSVVVLGGYIEPWAMVSQQEDASTSDFNQVIFLLVYVLFVTVVLRSVSFAIVQWPIIIEEYKHEQEKKQGGNLSRASNNLTAQSIAVETRIKDKTDLACALGLVNETEQDDESEGTRIWYDAKKPDSRSMTQQTGLSRWIEQSVRPFVRVASTCACALALRLRFWHEISFVITVGLAIYYQTPMPTAYVLLDILLWKSNKPVIFSIVHNLSELISTFILGILISYLYLLVGLWTFPESRNQDSCGNMFQCSVNMILRTYSLSGISDFFSSEFHVPNNVADAIADRSIWRFFFEFTYLIILGQCILAVVLAVIIDGMQALRIDRASAQSDLNNRCFVCDLTIFRLGQAGVVHRAVNVNCMCFVCTIMCHMIG